MITFYLFPEILLAYLIGSIPSAVWMGKLFYNTDVRQHGSGNAGATNVIRVLGYKAVSLCWLFDVFKGWAAVQIIFLFPHAELSRDLITYVRICMAFAAESTSVMFSWYLLVLKAAKVLEPLPERQLHFIRLHLSYCTFHCFIVTVTRYVSRLPFYVEYHFLSLLFLLRVSNIPDLSFSP